MLNEFDEAIDDVLFEDEFLDEFRSFDVLDFEDYQSEQLLDRAIDMAIGEIVSHKIGSMNLFDDWDQLEKLGKRFSNPKTLDLKDAPEKLRKMGFKRGIYVILKRNKRVYVGKSKNLPVRISKNRLGLKQMALPEHKKTVVNSYKVRVFHFPTANNTTLLARERKYRERFPGVFSEQINTAE